MTKQYNLKVSVQTAKPRSKRLRLSGGTARSEVSSAGIYESGLDLSRYLEKELFDDLFEKVQVNGQWVIRAKYGFYSNQFISALGMVQGDLGGGSGTGGSLFGLMRSWPSVDPGPSTQEALGANLGWELRNRIAALETAGYATQNWVLNKNYLTAHQDISHLLSKTEAASLYQPKGNYLTSHQSLAHLLSKTEAASLYQPKGNYLTGITKAMVEAVLTGTITTHNHDSRYYTEAEIDTKITALNTAIGTKLDKSVFDDMFEKIQVGGQWVIRAKYGFYSNQFISALGMVQGDLGGGSGTGGSLFGLMRSWPSVDPGPSTQEALGANLGWELRNRIAALETAGFATQNWVLNKNYLTAHQDISHLLSKTEAASLYQPKGNYLTAHQDISHLLSKTEAASLYQPKGNYALASALGNYYTKTEVNTKLTDGSVTKVGTATVGSSNWPIYLNNGVPYACAWKFGNYNGAAAVNNGTLNENLNADMLDGLHVGEAPGRVARFSGFPAYSSFGYEGTSDETYFSYLLKKLATDNSGEIMAVGRAHPNSQGVFIMHGYSGRKNGYPQYGSGLYVSISGRVVPIRVLDGTYTYGNGIFEGNAASASRLQTTGTYTAWGQTYFANGVPQSVSGNMTGVGIIKFSAGNEIAFANSRFCFGATNQTVAQGVNVGSLLVSNVWADYTKVPVNGIYIKGALRIGDITIEEDKANGGLKISGGVYATQYVSALGQATGNLSGGSSGGGTAYDRLDAWADYTTDKAGYVLSAGLGADLNSRVGANATSINSILSRLNSLEGGGTTSVQVTGSGNAITDISKGGTAIIATKGATFLTQHQSLDYINTLDVRTTAVLTDSYKRQFRALFMFNSTDSLVDGGSFHNVLHISRWSDISGGKSSQLAFTDNGNMWMRVGTVGSAWEAWQKILTSANYSSTLDSRYVKKAGDTMTGNLSVPSISGITSTGLVSNLNADMLDGLHSTSFGRAFGNSNIDANDYNSLNGLWGGKLYNATNVPYTYYAFLHFGWGQYYGQFNAYNNQLQFRAGSESNGGPAWKTVAFTDSNVASATKLQTARTLWGQSFDGTGNVSGNLIDVGSIAAAGTIACGVLELSEASPWIDFHFNKSTADFTSRIIERASGQLSINNTLFATYSGNVGIRTTAPAYTLDVNGTARVASGVIAQGGVQIGSTDDCGWYNVSGRIAAGMGTARGVNVGSLLVSNAWADYTKVPVNGAYVKGQLWCGSLRIGDAIFTYDAAHNGIKLDKGLYSEGYLSALGLSELTNTKFTISAGYESDALTILNGGIYRSEYWGDGWNKGHGALNVAIHGSSASQQTPLLLAVKADIPKTGWDAPGARLFAMELLDNGEQMKFQMGGSTIATLHKTNGLMATSLSVQTIKLNGGGTLTYDSATGDLKLNGKKILVATT